MTKHEWVDNACTKCGMTRVNYHVEPKWTYFPNLPGHPFVVTEEGECPQTKFVFEE